MSEYPPEILLDTCSDSVRDGYDFLITNAEKLGNPHGIYHLDDCTVFFVLDKIKPEISKKYIDNIGDKYNSTTADYDVATYPYRLWYFIRLCKKYDVDYHNSEALLYHTDVVKNWQNRDGSLPGEINTTGRLRLLNEFEPNSPVTLRAEEYYRNNWDNSTGSKELALGILALSEMNYDRYEPIINSLASKLSDEQSYEGYFGQAISDPSEPDLPRVLPLEATGLSMKALARVGGYTDEIDSAKEWLKGEQKTNGSWIQNEHTHHRSLRHPLISTSYALLGLNTTTEGPKVSQSVRDWKIELERQRKERDKPRFVQTFPSSDLDERKVEIHDRADAMIMSAEDRLRISALMIDMLHEKIIDKIDQGVDVYILTRMGHDRGERKKLKKAVLKELVKETEGNVRSDKLLHSRFLIADDRELLLSTADLTRDQLHDQFNSGIYTEDKGAINDAIGYFEAVWEEAESINPH